MDKWKWDHYCFDLLQKIAGISKGKKNKENRKC